MNTLTNNEICQVHGAGFQDDVVTSAATLVTGSYIADAGAAIGQGLAVGLVAPILPAASSIAAMAGAASGAGSALALAYKAYDNYSDGALTNTINELCAS